MKNHAVRLFALVAALSLAVAAFGQGLYTESQTSGGPLGERVIVSKSFYMPKMIKAISDEDGNAMIFRLDRQIIYEVNPKDKTYAETSFAEWEQRMQGLNSKMDARMAQLQKQLEGMPPEQRKMVEQMMPKGMGGASTQDAKMEVAKTGEKKSVSGYNCTKYAVNEDGKEVLTLWTTRDIKAFDAMKKDYQEFSKRFMSVNLKGMKGLAEAMQKVDGFPMEMDFAEGMKTTVSKAEPRAIPASEFEVPQGFAKVKSKLTEVEEKSGE